MGSGPSKMEAVQADEGSERAKLGPQYRGTGCLPAGVGASQSEHKLDHAVGQRIPRATNGRDAGRSADAGTGAGRWETSIYSAGKGNGGETRWAKRDHHRTG